MQTADCLTADSGTGLPHPTLRLTLRTWAEADKIPFRIQNADPRVWEHFPIDALSAAESDAAVDRFCAHQLTHGFCFWATEISESKQFIGYVGLNIYSWTVDRAPVVEIGWRLAHEQWSKGFATEAARSVLEFAFCEMRAPEIVAITAATNERSQRIMRRLGMRHSPTDDFRHPAVPTNHPLSPHVMYRLSKADWSANNDADSGA